MAKEQKCVKHFLLYDYRWIYRNSSVGTQGVLVYNSKMDIL
jgi:hypothetical protein